MTGATPPLGEGGTDTRDVNQHGCRVTINPRNRGVAPVTAPPFRNCSGHPVWNSPGLPLWNCSGPHVWNSSGTAS